MEFLLVDGICDRCNDWDKISDEARADFKGKYGYDYMTKDSTKEEVKYWTFIYNYYKKFFSQPCLLIEHEGDEVLICRNCLNSYFEEGKP
jgi:hypothetical protein